MNKKELIAAIANRTEMKQADAKQVVEAFTEIITEELAKGESVQIMGFGSFEVKENAEREARNPQTGEKITVAASKSPKFKAGKALKDAVNA